MSFEVLFETNLDDFSFKVPFMLNLMLNASPDQTIQDNLNISYDEKNQIQLVVQEKKNHENLLVKNNFYKHKEGGFFMLV